MQKRLFGLLASVVMIVTACGGTTTSNPPSSGGSQPPAASGASTAPATESANFRFGIGGEPTYFSNSADDDNTAYVTSLIYNDLLTVNNKGEVIPDLAAALPTVSSDNLTMTVKLRDNVKWQDGTPFTSADVLFTYNIALSAKCSFYSVVCGQWRDNVAKVEAPDATTVIITLKAPYAPIYIYNFAGTFIQPKAATEASYAKFTGASGAVKAGDVKALLDKITTAQAAKDCAASPPPPLPTTCLASTYTTDMEGSLTSGGVTLPDKARYTTTDAGGATVPDPEAYAAVLLAQLTDLNTTLAASEADKLAAAFRLLDINLKPIGTGPYKLGTYKPGESIELIRNDSYFAYVPGAPKVEIPIIKDAGATADALASGNVDYDNTIISSDALAKLKAASNIKVSEYADQGYYYFAFNVRPGHVFSDKVTRDALKMCIDPLPTIAAATDGNGIPVQSFVPPGDVGLYDPTLPPYKYDVAGAKALLEGAGYKLNADGIYQKGNVKLQADLRVRKGRPQRIKYAELARDQVKDCGIGLNVIETDFSILIGPVLNYPNKFDIYLGGYQFVGDPELSSSYACAHVVTATNPSDDNATGFCDKHEDELFTAAKRELDVTKRKALLTELAKYDVANGPYYYLWADLGHRGYSTKMSTTGAQGPIDYTTFYDFWNEGTWIVQK